MIVALTVLLLQNVGVIVAQPVVVNTIVVGSLAESQYSYYKGSKDTKELYDKALAQDPDW